MRRIVEKKLGFLRKKLVETLEKTSEILGKKFGNSGKEYYKEGWVWFV